MAVGRLIFKNIPPTPNILKQASLRQKDIFFQKRKIGNKINAVKIPATIAKRAPLLAKIREENKIVKAQKP